MIDTDTFHPKATDILERICDAQWTLHSDRGTHNGVTFTDVHQEDACNHVLSGNIDVDGETFGFVIENGNWVGTRVLQWGDPEDLHAYKPIEPEPITFLPEDDFFYIDPFKLKCYILMRKCLWFKEYVGKYAYDRHFQPGGYVEDYYRKIAASRGMKPGYLTHLPEDIQKQIRENE